MRFRSDENGWPDSLLKNCFFKRADFMVPFREASLAGPEAAKQPQTIRLSPPYFTVGMSFLF